MTIEQGVDFVLKCLGIMSGGEIFIPKMPSMRITDLAEAIAPRARRRITGIRPGEKLHETLIPEDESHNTFESRDMYMILTPFRVQRPHKGFRRVKDGFRYSSNTNTDWLTAKAIKRLIGEDEE
jgi:UDP-N-acetylglucosamine 4,6-dehydratase